MRPLVVVSKDNVASQNIKSSLLRLERVEGGEEGLWSAADFDIAEYPGSIVEIVPTHDAEYYIFASTHRSASNTPSLTVHTPGNWGPAELGGKERCLNTAYAGKVKSVAQEMARLAPLLSGWSVSVEVDHHGPTLRRPVLFAEIGSGEGQWKNPVAGEIVARSIIAAIRDRREFECHIGFGGTHYAPKFTPRIIGTGIAMGHIISGYALQRDGADEEMALQAFGRNVERAGSALVDWKGIKGESRAKLVSVLEAAGIPWSKA